MPLSPNNALQRYDAPKLKNGATLRRLPPGAFLETSLFCNICTRSQHKGKARLMAWTMEEAVGDEEWCRAVYELVRKNREG